jgi:O-antigen ligase
LVATIVIIMVRHHRLNYSFKHIQWAIGDLYYNHVDYSTLVSMFFPLLWVAYPMIKKYSIFIKVGLVALIAFFLIAIYLTYARAAMVAVFFCIAVGIAMRLKLVNYIMPTLYGLIALGLVYLGHNNKYIDLRPNFKETYMHTNFADHIIATFRGEDMSSMERLYRWIAAIRMSADKPITGYGPHAFYHFYQSYAVSSFRTYVSNNWEESTTHNYFLYMLVEQGWPAMLLYALLVFVVFAQAQRTYHRFKDKFYKNCTLGLAMTFAASFINNFFSELIETHKVGALFYITIALLIVLDRKSREMAGEVAPEEEETIA